MEKKTHATINKQTRIANKKNLSTTDIIHRYIRFLLEIKYSNLGVLQCVN